MTFTVVTGARLACGHHNAPEPQRRATCFEDRPACPTCACGRWESHCPAGVFGPTSTQTSGCFESRPCFPASRKGDRLGSHSGDGDVPRKPCAFSLPARGASRGLAPRNHGASCCQCKIPRRVELGIQTGKLGSLHTFECAHKTPITHRAYRPDGADGPGACLAHPFREHRTQHR